MYPVNLIPKSNPEKRFHLTLTSKHTLSKRTSRNLTLKCYPEKRFHLTLASKRDPPKTYPPKP